MKKAFGMKKLPSHMIPTKNIFGPHIPSLTHLENPSLVKVERAIKKWNTTSTKLSLSRVKDEKMLNFT